MRRVVLIGLVLCVAYPAHAQTRVYVSGDLFAEITRMSRTTVTPENVVVSSSPVEGVTGGGGARIGAFFSPEWSLELGVDLGRTLDQVRTQTVTSPISVGLRIPPQQFQAHASSRFTATSVLIGYHPAVGGRIRAGFRGGLSLMRTERTSSSASISSVTLLGPIFPLPGPQPPVPVITLDTTEVATIAYGLAATLAAEAAIEISRHFAVVPEMRVLAGGLGGFVLRPGMAARWTW